MNIRVHWKMKYWKRSIQYVDLDSSIEVKLFGSFFFDFLGVESRDFCDSPLFWSLYTDWMLPEFLGMDGDTNWNEFSGKLQRGGSFSIQKFSHWNSHWSRKFFTNIGRSWATEETKYVLRPVKQWEQLGNMHNLISKTFLNKNPPTSPPPRHEIYQKLKTIRFLDHKFHTLKPLEWVAIFNLDKKDQVYQFSVAANFTFAPSP